MINLTSRYPCYSGDKESDELYEAIVADDVDAALSEREQESEEVEITEEMFLAAQELFSRII